MHQLGSGALESVKCGVPLVETPGDVLAHNRLEQLYLAGEVQKQRAFGHTRPHRDVFHARTGKAFFNEQGQSRLHQLAWARVFAALAARLFVCWGVTNDHGMLVTDQLVSNVSKFAGHGFQLQQRGLSGMS